MQTMQLSTKTTFIRDTRGKRYTIQECIGQGSLGKVYRAEDIETGHCLAAKLPFLQTDYQNPPSHDIIETYSRLIRDESAYLKRFPPEFMPQSVFLVDGGNAVPCLIQDFLQDSFISRIEGGLLFSDLCLLLSKICDLIQILHNEKMFHGNLKPGNIFFYKSESNAEEKIVLTDPMFPSYLKHLKELNKQTPNLISWYPQEVQSAESIQDLSQSIDTFMIGKVLFDAVLLYVDTSKSLDKDHSNFGYNEFNSMDKSATARFRGALAQLLLEQESNPNTRETLIRRTISLLSRALSLEKEPSPPYRFYSASEMSSRLSEIASLFHPQIQQMGSILLDPAKTSAIFQEGEDILFSLSFKCPPGIENTELINCMTYVRDVRLGQKVREANFEVLPHCDGNRFRYSFRLPSLKSGQYIIRVAFGVRGTPTKPVHRDLQIDITENEDLKKQEKHKHSALQSNVSDKKKHLPQNTTSHQEKLRTKGHIENDEILDDYSEPTIPQAPAAPSAQQFAVLPLTPQQVKLNSKEEDLLDIHDKRISTVLSVATNASNVVSTTAPTAASTLAIKTIPVEKNTDKVSQEFVLNQRDMRKESSIIENTSARNDVFEKKESFTTKNKIDTNAEEDVELDVEIEANTAAIHLNPIKSATTPDSNSKAVSTSLRVKLQKADKNTNDVVEANEKKSVQIIPVMEPKKPYKASNDMDVAPSVWPPTTAYSSSKQSLKNAKTSQKGANDSNEHSSFYQKAQISALIKETLEVSDDSYDESDRTQIIPNRQIREANKIQISSKNNESKDERAYSSSKFNSNKEHYDKSDKHSSEQTARQYSKDAQSEETVEKNKFWDKFNPSKKSSYNKKPQNSLDNEPKNANSYSYKNYESNYEHQNRQPNNVNNNSNRPAEQFIPEIYYKDARTKPPPGENDELYYEQGTLKPRQYFVLISMLVMILVGLISMIIWLLFF